MFKAFNIVIVFYLHMLLLYLFIEDIDWLCNVSPPVQFFYMKKVSIFFQI